MPSPGRLLLGLGFIGVGILALTSRRFASVWQPVPAFADRTTFAAMIGAIELVLGAALLGPRQAAVTRYAAAVLFGFVAVWWLLLKIPPILTAPMVEGSWLGAGEISLILTGAWVLFATVTVDRPRQVRIAQIWFGLACIPIGLSHLAYPTDTLALVPHWLPVRSFWANAAGIGQMAAGAGVLLGVYPRLAARSEAVMIFVFTLLVWGPALLSASAGRAQWLTFIMSWTIGAGAWVVADSFAGVPWLAMRTRRTT